MFFYIRKYRRPLVIAFLLALFASLLGVRIQFLKGKLLDIAIARNVDDLYLQIAWFVAFLIAAMAANQLYKHITLRVVTGISRDIKNRIFDSCLNRGLSRLNTLDRASVIARYTTDLNMVYTNGLMMGSRFFEFALTILTSGGALFLVSYRIGLLTLAVFVLPMLITNALKNSISKAEHEYIQTNKKHLDQLMKYLGGLEAIKNYSIEREVEAIYGSSLETLAKSDIKRSFKRSLANGMSFFTTMFSQAAILIYSTWLLYHGELSVAHYVTIFSLVLVLRPPFYWISQLYEGIIASRPALQSIESLIQESPEPTAKRNAQATNDTASEVPGAIAVENLTFSFGGIETPPAPVIKGLNIRIEPGEKVWITGESGSGKSTLVKLLVGLLEPTQGQIRMGGEFSYFTQDAFLFAGSLKDNITLYNDKIPREDFDRVTRICGLDALLRENRPVAEQGSNLSGGEKKRIALARALLYDKDILILDEPLANIDPENIERIEEAIIQDKKHTILLISHIGSDRLKHRMDKIIHLSE